MKLPVRTAALGGAVLLAAAVVAGCSSSDDSATTASSVSSMPIIHGLETTKVVVADYPAIDSGGLFVAQTEGLFKKEGLDVTIIPDFTSSQDTVDKLESGVAQVSSGDYVTYMNDYTGKTGGGKDANLEIVGEVSVLQPNNLALMVSGTSKITKLSQLKGKQIPISGADDIGNLLVDSVLTDNHVSPSAVKFVENIPLPKVPYLLAKGTYDAGPVPEPFVSQGEQQFGDEVLADLDQGSTTNFPIEGLTVTRQWAQANPNTLRAFVTAVDEGQEIADTNRAALEQALVKIGILGVKLNQVSVISIPDYPIGIDADRIQRVLSDMIEFGFFKGQPAALAKAKAFKVSSVVWAANRATSDGGSTLLNGG